MTIKWSAFPAGSAISNTDIPVGLQSGANVQWTWTQVRTWLLGSSTAALSIAAGKTLTMTQNLTLPSTDGSSGQFLQTDGAGVTSWSTVPIGITIGSTTITSGTTTRILYDNAGVVGEYTISGSGTVVAMATSPSFTTPTLGVASATTINKVALTAPATGSTLTIADGKTLTSSVTMTLQGGDASVLSIAAGKTLTASNTLTFTGTDSSSVAFGTGGTVLYTASTIPLTVGTTTIASGTNTRILYNNSGVLGEYTLTGSGTVVAMQTAPTFATSITTPSVLATANDSGALGASGTAFSDLFLASGGVINWNAGNFTLTHSAGLLTANGALTATTLTATTSFNGPAGTASAVTFGVNAANTGMYEGASGQIGFAHAGVLNYLMAATALSLRNTVVLRWGSGSPAGAVDLLLLRDAAATLGQRDGTNAQVSNLYDTYTSATDYHRVALKTARATLSAVSGASVTATGLIPDGAVVVGVTTKVTTGLGTSNGTTGYAVGTGADPNRWGDIVGTIAGTSSDNRDWTSGLIEASIGDTDVIITAAGGNFNGTGVIYVSVQYLIGQCD